MIQLQNIQHSLIFIYILYVSIWSDILDLNFWFIVFESKLHAVGTLIIVGSRLNDPNFKFGILV